MSDQLVTGTTTYTTHNKHKLLISMLTVGFEAAIPAIKWPRTYALSHTVNVIYIYIN